MAAGRDERASVRAAQRGSASGIEALFRLHWPRAYRAAYLVVHDAAAAEDIAQEAFLAPSATSTASTAAARSGPGCTGSSSTARSTGRGRGQLRRDRAAGGRRRAEQPARSTDRCRRARGAPARAPRRDRPPLPARVHARRDRGAARPPARDGQLPAPPRARRAEGARCEARARADRDPGRARGARAHVAVVRAAFGSASRSRRAVREPLARSRSRSSSSAACSARPGARSSTTSGRRSGSRRRAGALLAPAPGRLLVTADSGAWVVERTARSACSAVPRGVVVAVRPLRRRVPQERAGRARAGRRCALVARTPARPLPALGRHANRHADRLSLAAAAARRRRRRQGRPRARRPARPARTCGSPARVHVLAYTRRDGAVRVVDADTGACSRGSGPRRWRGDAATCGRAGREVGQVRRASSVARRPLARGRLARRRSARLRPPCGGRQIRAVSNVSSQFRSRLSPISGWCCAP